MASIADIAKKLNLSNSTVSRALRDSGLVTKETREKVLLAAQEVGYEVNAIARKLRSGESKTIGVIVSDITNLFHGEIITAIQKVAIDNGYTVIFGTSSEDEATEKELIDLLKSNMLQGLIIVPTHQSIKAPAARSMPCPRSGTDTPPSSEARLCPPELTVHHLQS